MSLGTQERKEWLTRNVLPYEPLIRARLKYMRVADLDVDDVIQEMYARLLSAPAVETVRYPRQYAIQTAKGIIIDHLRRSRVVSIVSGGSLDQLDVAQPDASVEEHMEFQDEIQEVAKALAQLPETYRETLILRRVEGLSQKETAQRLGVTEKTVENHTARGLAMLIKLFGKEGKPRARSSSNEVDQVIVEDELHKR